MRPKNFDERKKRMLTFAGLYAASVILMFFIFSAFGVHLSVNQKMDMKGDGSQAEANNDILESDSLLHAKLRHLQQSDDVYTLLLADSGSLLQKNNAEAMISMYESALKKAIDSVDQVSTSYSGDKATMFKTMVNSFKSIINNRQALKNIQASMVSGKTVLTSSQQDLLQWKNELGEKDNEITRLNADMKALQGKVFIPKSAGVEEARKGENELLKTAFSNQEKEYNDIKEKYSRLKTENTNLSSLVVEYKKAAFNSTQNENVNNAAENKINMLEQKVKDLSADIYFTKIDCNLTRADALQIISNARQRKELLSESLAMLNSLSTSADAGIQKKAKEKIARLNHIAITLHD